MAYYLNWNASTDTESGVSHYRVFKDAVYQGQVSHPTVRYYTGESEPTGCWSVSAVDNATNESAQATCISYLTLETLYSEIGYLDSATACSVGGELDPVSLYTDRTDPDFPQIGDIITTDAGGNNRFNGDNKWWYNYEWPTAVQISTNGVVLNTSSCF